MTEDRGQRSEVGGKRGGAAQCLLAIVLMSAATTVARAELRVVRDKVALRQLETPQRFLQLSASGDPVEWSAAYPAIDNANTSVSFVDGPNSSVMRIVVEGNDELTREISGLSYEVNRTEGNGKVGLRFLSAPIAEGVRLEKVYLATVSENMMSFRARFVGEGAGTFAASNRLAIMLGYDDCFVPPPVPGFAGSYEKVKGVYLEEGEQHEIEWLQEEGETGGLRMPGWVGFRNRFWAFMMRPAKGALMLVVPVKGRDGGKQLRVVPESHDGSIRLAIYAGPISREILLREDPELRHLLFTGLWQWMKWLCIGLLLLLDRLINVIGDAGLAIVALSLCVKILMIPLTFLAEHWQKDVNRKKSILQPHLDELKGKYKGEEHTKRVVAIHKEHGIHQLFALKSLFGVLIQIPVFIAAFHMLSENIELSGISFLWIQDLARPDRIAALPFVIPFFGGHLNLLPFLMTAVTVLSSWHFDDGSLSPELLRQERRNLYWMALLFFVLFYTFPAGMVLYWTTNNLLAFIKDRIVDARRQRSDVSKEDVPSDI